MPVCGLPKSYHAVFRKEQEETSFQFSIIKFINSQTGLHVASKGMTTLQREWAGRGNRLSLLLVHAPINGMPETSNSVALC
jgi:hypothetical protein